MLHFALPPTHAAPSCNRALRVIGFLLASLCAIATQAAPVATNVIASGYFSAQNPLERSEALRRVTDGGQSSVPEQKFDTYYNDRLRQSAGLIYLPPSGSTAAAQFNTVQIDMGGGDDNGGDFVTLPKLYLLKHNSDPNSFDPSSDERFVDTGLVPTKFINVAATSSYTFDLSGLTPAARTGYGFAVVATSACGGANYIAVSEISATAVAAPAPVLQPYYVRFEGHRYARTFTRGTWQQCEAEAVAAGGHLVSITRASEQAFISQTFGLEEELYIGAKQTAGSAEPDSGFVWVNGDAFPPPPYPSANGYTNFAAGQPDNFDDGTGPDSYVILNYFAGSWSDAGAAGYPVGEYRGIIELPTPGTEVNAQVNVAGHANIFGAGKTGADATPGGGSAPVLTNLPVGATSIQFSAVLGTAHSGGGAADPDGLGSAALESTDLTGDKGIAGLVDGNNAFMLVGVFIAATTPADPQPERLDFSSGALGEDFASLAPELGQVFFIGDGRTGNGSGAVQQFIIPAGATRFYLGLADGQDGTNYHGPPNAYGDNYGFFTARFAFKDGPVIVPSKFPLSGSLTVSGGTGALTFAVTSGALPTGLTLAADGTIGGAPSANGTYTFTVKVTDTQGRFSERTFTSVIATPVAVPAGLVAWFGADRAAHDSFGPLRAYAQGVGYEKGKVGYAFKFNGDGNSPGGFVTAPNSPSLALAGDLTIEGWINPMATAGTTHAIASKRGNSSGDTTFLLTHQSDGQLTFTVGSNGAYQILSSGAQALSQVFSHVAVTISGTTVTFYINGVAAPAQTIAGTRPVTDGPLTLGGQIYPGGVQYPFAGLLDEISIYNRALSAEQVAQISNAGTAGKFTYEIERGFSATANPSGPWSYAFMPAAAEPNVGNITNFTQKATDGPLQLWRKPGSTFPQVGRNPSASQYEPWQIGEIGLHPGQFGEYAAICWTAPAPGAYALAATFRQMTPTANGVKVRIEIVTPANSTSGALHQSLLDPNTIVNFSEPEYTFLDSVTLTTGQQVVFIADANGDPNSDSTALAASITPMQAAEVTAPATFTIATKTPYANGREWVFKATDTDVAPGLALLVEAGDGGSNWSPIGAMTRQAGSAGLWTLTTRTIPTGPQIFRVRATAPGAPSKSTLYPSNSAPLTLQVGTLPLAKPADKLRVTLIGGNKGAQTIPESGTLEFLATQTADASNPNLQVDVETTGTPTNASSWRFFTSLRRNAGAKTWTDTKSPADPGPVYFRTVTYSDDLAPAALPVAVGPVTVTASQALALTIKAEPASSPNDPSRTHPGEFITYRLRYENNGSVAATNVAVAAKLPKNTTYAGEQGGGHSADAVPLVVGREVGGVFFPVGSLAPQARGERYFTVQVDGDILEKAATATIAFQTYDSDLSTAPMSMGRSAKVLAAVFTDKADAPGRMVGYPADGVSTQVYRPLEIQLTQDRDSARPGDLIQYTFTLKNHSAAALSNVKLTQILPGYTELETFASFVPSGGSFNGAARRADEYQDTPADSTRPSYKRAPLRVLEWLFPGIPGGAQRVAIFTVRLQADTPLQRSDIFGPSGFPLRIVNNSMLFSASYASGAKTLSGDAHGQTPPEIELIPEYPVDRPQIQFERDAIGLGEGRGEVFYGGRTVATVGPGDLIEYRLVYRNLGGAVARHCVITEEIAEGGTFYGFLSINGQSPNPLNYTFYKANNAKLTQVEASDSEKIKLTRKLVLSLGDLAPGASGVLSYRVRAGGLPPREKPAAVGDVLTSASFSMSTDSLSKAETGTPTEVPVLIVRPAAFTLETTVPERLTPYKAGETIDFIARYRNEGGIVSAPAMVVAEMAEGVEFVSAHVFDAADQEITVPVKSTPQRVNFSVGALNGYEPSAPNDPYNGGTIQLRVKLANPLPARLRRPPFRAVVQMVIDKDPTPSGSVLRSEGLTPGAPPLADLLSGAYVRKEITVADSKPGILWAAKTMGKYTDRYQRMAIKISYGNCGDVAIPNVRVAIQIPYGTVLVANESTPGVKLGDKTPGYALKNDIAHWSVGTVGPSGCGVCILVVDIKKDTKYKHDVFTETTAYVGSLDPGAAVQDAIPGPVCTIVGSGDPAINAGKAWGSQLGASGGNLRGASSPELRSAIASVRNAHTTSLSGVDYFALPNGGFIVQNGSGNVVAGGGGNVVAGGGGNVVAGGGGNVVAGGGGNVVAGGGGNVVAAGAGNFISVNGVGLCTTANLKSFAASVVAGGAGNIVAGGAGNIVNTGGQSFLQNGVASLIANDGGTITQNGSPLQIGFASSSVIPAGAGNAVALGVGQLLPTGISSLIGQDGASAVSLQGSALVSGRGATLIANDGGTLISYPAAGLIGNDGAGLIGNDGAGLIGNDGSGLISNDGAGLRLRNGFAEIAPKVAQ